MKMNRPQKVGFALAMSAFIYLTCVLLMQNTPLNLSTWVLWTVIDTSLLVSMIKSKNEGVWLMAAFALGASTIAIIALIKFFIGIGELSWHGTETLAAVSVVIALLVWKRTDVYGGVIAVTIAMYIAMIPTLINGWMYPIGQLPLFWGVSSIACLFTYSGSPRSFVERLMPACGAFFNGLMALIALRQFFF
jgi:hypothetical protein